MRKLNIILQLALILLSVTVYSKVLHCDFVGFDDEQYITKNPHLRKGLSTGGITWAFTSRYASNWHPLTWISHLLDYELFGTSPKGPHIVNLGLHTLSTLLLFQLLKRMTGLTWPSFFVAMLFAIHPLHVESVVWIAERKDVLSTFFMMLTLLAYAEYAKSKSKKWYALALMSFLFGLLSKPMLVTLPFVLILLDFWPLNRFAGLSKQSLGKSQVKRSTVEILTEKVPFFVLTLLSCVLTVWAQAKSGAVASLESHSIPSRLSTACIAYVAYLSKTFWPVNLAAFYPHPGNAISWVMAAIALFFLLFFTVVAIRYARRYPYLPVGWFWYLGTLVPVIGLVQVGHQLMADRYTYIPLIGIFIIVAWGVAESIQKMRHLRILVLVVSSLAIVSLFPLTWLQIDHWKNAVTLCERILKVSGDSFVGHNNLGSALLERGNSERAVLHFQKAAQIEEKNPDVHFNLGVALYRSGNLREAFASLTKALELNSDHAEAHNQIGMVLADVNRKEEAVQHYLKAIEIRPELSGPRNNLAIELASQGKMDEAVKQFEEALKYEPQNLEILNNAGVILRDAGNAEKGMSFISKALNLAPQNPTTLKNLAQTLAVLGRKDEAYHYFTQALQFAPQDAVSRYHFAIFLKNNQKIPEAIKHLKLALELSPGFSEAQVELQRLNYP